MLGLHACDVVILQKHRKLSILLPEVAGKSIFPLVPILLSKTVELWVLFNLQQDIYTATVRVAFGCITLRIN